MLKKYQQRRSNLTTKMFIQKDLVWAHIEDQTAGVAGKHPKLTRGQQHVMTQSLKQEKLTMVVVGVILLALATFNWWAPAVFS